MTDPSPRTSDARARTWAPAVRDSALAGAVFFILTTVFGVANWPERVALAVILALACLGFATVAARKERA